MVVTNLKKCLLAFIIASLWSLTLLALLIIGNLVRTDMLYSMENDSAF